MTQEQSLTLMQKLEIELEEREMERELTRDDYSRGLAQGYEIGTRKIAAKIAKKMLLELKLNIDTVRKVTKLPKGQLKQILEESEEE